MDGHAPVPTPLTFAPPEGWQLVTVPPPQGSSDGELSVDSWSVWQDPPTPTHARPSGHAVAACLGVNLSTWTDEAAPIAQERLVGTLSAVATNLGSGGMVGLRAADRQGDVVSQDFVGTGDSEGKLAARTFLGFVDAPQASRLEGCFVLCAPTTAACESALKAAVPGPAFVAPPIASLPLRAVVLGVHHPRAVVMGATAVFVMLGLAAIWTRPRPHTK